MPCKAEKTIPRGNPVEVPHSHEVSLHRLEDGGRASKLGDPHLPVNEGFFLDNVASTRVGRTKLLGLAMPMLDGQTWFVCGHALASQYPLSFPYITKFWLAFG